MKLLNIALLMCLAIFASCEKQGEINEPNFEVTNYTVKSVLDTAGNAVKQVTFNFKGDASIISFYPGVLGNDYAYREGRMLGVGALLSSFSTTLDNGTQDNQLSVMVSSDFSGTYDITNIRAATWADITGRYVLNTRGASASLPSGTKDIKDLLVEGKPLYYGFRYICKPQTPFGVNSTWRIRAFSLQSQNELGTVALATLTTADWKLINDGAIVDAGRGAAIESSGNVRFNGNHLTKEVLTESWAISKGFEVGKVDMGPDRPIAIKTSIDTQMNTYSFTYSTPGTYKVAFIATNASYKGQEQVIREIEIIVP
ncbi:MAG: DUF5017 domain-containing protein [Bacteroidota bacterium]